MRIRPRQGVPRLVLCAAAICVAAAGSAGAVHGQPAPFVTTWETTATGESITIPVGGAEGAYAVDWGDGSSTEHSGDATHAYGSPGTYTVKVTGDFARIYLGGDPGNAAKLR